jgi:predicted ATPase
MALAFASVVHLCRGEADAAGVCVDEMVTLATEHGFLTPKAIAITLQGQVMIAQGAIVTGIARLEQGLVGWRDTGAQASRSHVLIRLAEAYGKAGQLKQGLAVTAEAETFIARTDERFWEAELYRVKGDLLLLQGAEASEAESCYRQGIEVARHQAARSLELRATLRLCRLWQRQGKSADAYQRLAAIVGWFSEGFETADLIAARALLATLG